MMDETLCFIDMDEDGYHVRGIDGEPYAIACTTPQEALDKAESFGLEVVNIEVVWAWCEQRYQRD